MNACCPPMCHFETAEKADRADRTAAVLRHVHHSLPKQSHCSFLSQLVFVGRLGETILEIRELIEFRLLHVQRLL